jgi:hypothetical protein
MKTPQREYRRGERRPKPKERDPVKDAMDLARQYVNQDWPLTDDEARNLTRILMGARAEAAYSPKSRGR